MDHARAEIAGGIDGITRRSTQGQTDGHDDEGDGNRAVVVVNGRSFTDDNVTIHSSRNRREISMSVRILGQKVDRIAVVKVDPDEAKLKFEAEGEEHVLVLTKR